MLGEPFGKKIVVGRRELTDRRIHHADVIPTPEGHSTDLAVIAIGRHESTARPTFDKRCDRRHQFGGVDGLREMHFEARVERFGAILGPRERRQRGGWNLTRGGIR
jgi:hypothetical protein